MADYYTSSSDPADHSDADPAVLRAEHALIQAGFAKVAGYTGAGKLIPYINSGGTAQETNTNFNFTAANEVIKVGGPGTTVRGTTEGTKHLDLFDGTEPVGTLANGVSIYSKAGNLWAINSAGVKVQLTGNPVLSYFQAGATAGVTIKSGAGKLHGVVWSQTSNDILTFILYDNTAASGTILHQSQLSNGAIDIPVSLDFHGLPFSTGLELVVTGTTSKLTVMYE